MKKEPRGFLGMLVAAWQLSRQLKRERLAAPSTPQTTEAVFLPPGATMGQRLAIDFDGVLSDYSGGWGRSDSEILGGPVEGCFEMLRAYQQEYELWIHSVRCRSLEGQQAIAQWIDHWDRAWCAEQRREGKGEPEVLRIHLCAEKPPAWAYLDDRGISFQGPGTWPTIEDLRAFRPWWNKMAIAERA